MLTPGVFARVEQRHLRARDRIGRGGLVVFVVVTTLAGQREVVGPNGATAAARLHLLHGERMTRKTGLTAAVVATAPRSACHLPLQFASPCLTHPPAHGS